MLLTFFLLRFMPAREQAKKVDSSAQTASTKERFLQKVEIFASRRAPHFLKYRTRNLVPGLSVIHAGKK
jgi:hypothetical protein